MSEKNKKSGGVKTEAGKAISRYNAQRHSILRETPSEYEEADASKIYNDLADDLKPDGVVQETLVQLIAVNLIKLTRLAKSEVELIKSALSPKKMEIPDLCGKEYEPRLHYASDGFVLYSRYQTMIENRIYRAIKSLRELQGYEQGERD